MVRGDLARPVAVQAHGPHQPHPRCSRRRMPQPMPLTGLRPIQHRVHLPGAQYAVVVLMHSADFGLQSLVAHSPGTGGTGLAGAVGGRGDLDADADKRLAEPAQTPRSALLPVNEGIDDLYRRSHSARGAYTRTALRRISLARPLLAYFLLQLPDPLGILARGSRPGAAIDLGLLHPGTQRLEAGRPTPRRSYGSPPLDRSGSRRAPAHPIRVARSHNSQWYFLCALPTVILPCVHCLHQTRYSSESRKKIVWQIPSVPR